MVDPADSVVSTEVPGRDADASRNIVIRMAAIVTTRRSQDMRPPQLVLHFYRRAISPSTHAVERANFIVHQPYQNIIRQDAWYEETRRMLSHVAAGHVRTAELGLLVLAFRRYTRTVLHHFPIMELSAMEFLAVIEIPPAVPSNSASRLRYSVSLETFRFSLGGEGDDDIRGPTPAPTAAVEGLRKKITEEPGVCSICLDDFDVATEVLEMPCRHIFHDKCVREWLSRSNTCPLCRLTLLPEAQ